MLTKSELNNVIRVCESMIAELEEKESRYHVTRVLGLHDWIKTLSFCKQEDGQTKLLIDRDTGVKYFVRQEV